MSATEIQGSDPAVVISLGYHNQESLPRRNWVLGSCKENIVFDQQMQAGSVSQTGDLCSHTESCDQKDL